MSRPLVSAPLLRSGELGAATLSVAAHASLIAFAVSLAARPTPSAPREHRVGTEHLQYVLTFKTAEAVPARAARTRPAAARRRAALPRIPNFSKLHVPSIAPVILPTELPKIDFEAMASSTISVGDSDLNLGRAAINAIGATPNPDSIYSATVVDRGVAPYEDNPKPDYPSSLRRAGVEASLLVRYVVDASGRVEDESIELPNTVHRLFADAVRDALHRSRYYPALFGGVHVRQQVQQWFYFRIVDR